MGHVCPGDFINGDDPAVKADHTCLERKDSMDINQKYMLSPEDIKNVVSKDGNRIGVELKMLIPYYRGVALSMIDDLYVKINGLEFPKERLTFSLDGFTYRWPQIETVTTFRWEYGEKATVFVPLENGIEVTPKNIVEVGCAIRMSYGGRFPRPVVVKVTVDPCQMATVQY